MPIQRNEHLPSRRWLCTFCDSSVISPEGYHVTGLTERQQQCLRGVLERKTAKQIGRDLGITHHAVEKHLKAARQKLGVPNTLEAARGYASSLATVEPYYGPSEVPPHGGSILDQVSSDVAPERKSEKPLLLRDSASDSKGLAFELTVGQTLAAIALVSLGIVAILALLIAVAQGVDALTS